MIKKISIYFVLLFLWITFFINLAYWEWCEYESEIEQCIEANKSWTSKSIEDFVCIIGTREEISYQIVLDMKFKDLDDEMDTFIEDLETNKNKYFWKDREWNFIDWLNDIDLKKKYFKKEYSNICWIEIAKEIMSCNTNEKTSIANARNYFQETDCMALVDIKLTIFDDVTSSVLKQNKQQIKADEKKEYDQKERSNYDKLMDFMNQSIWYVERVWKKWPSKISDAY